MLSYIKIYPKEKKFLSLTSLLPEEFDHLLPTFRAAWYQYHKHFDSSARRRKKPKLSYQNETRTLPSVEDKLFFILDFLKNNPSQELLAAMFEIDQGQASRWIKILDRVLHESFDRLGYLPCQDGPNLAEFLRDKQPDCLIIDGMEQRTKRAVNDEAQKDKFSGKKKTTR